MSGRSAAFPHPLYHKYVLQPYYRDAKIYYFAPMMAANRAHVVMLCRCGIITRENAAALLMALDQVDLLGVAELALPSAAEDLFFAIEAKLIEFAGVAYGGNLQLARSRNDLGYALTRMALRPLLLAAAADLICLRESLLAFAREHLETLMPGYTHTQPAQPTTMAHYIAGMLAGLGRDMTRLRAAYATNNQSPLGAAALTGTAFPIDRQLCADLLGFDSVLLSTYDSIAASDNLTEAGAALTSLGVNLSRFSKDMLFWATRESGAIRIDDSFVQISSIMPQKRNPVVLEHLRARTSRMLAQAAGIALQCHNIPFGDTQDIEDEIFPLLFGSLETAQEILQLYAAVIDTLEVQVAHLRERAGAGFTTVTELADTLVRECRLSFRQAHSLVSAFVSAAAEGGLSPEQLTVAELQALAAEQLGITLDLPPEHFQRALDPAAFVHSRSLPGGAAPAATAAVLDAQAEQIAADRSWLQGRRQALAAADDALLTAARDLTG